MGYFFFLHYELYFLKTITEKIIRQNELELSTYVLLKRENCSGRLQEHYLTFDSITWPGHSIVLIYYLFMYLVYHQIGIMTS